MSGTIITVAQQKGGSGKTLLASLIAVAGQAGGTQNVAVLDVDPQGSLGEWFEHREALLGEDHTGLTLRTASGWGARRESRAMARDFDLVVVDTPPHADREARNAMELANLVVVPVQPTPTDLWATGATLELTASERTRPLLVMNRVPPRARLTAEIEASLAEMGAPLATCRLGNRVAYAERFGQGSSALEGPKRSTAAQEAAALTAELLNAASVEAAAA